MVNTTASPLSTTAFAILGLVRTAPGSAYDLNKRMEITYAYFWPRARSLVFAETKKLAAGGFVAGTVQHTGARARTVYAITPSGEDALRQWLATPPTVFGLEIEALVRLYLADSGDRRAIEGAVLAVEHEAERMLAIARTVIPAYLDGRPPPPVDDVATRALLIDFLAGFAAFTHSWAQRARQEVATWDDIGDEVRTQRALQRLRAVLPR